MNDPNERKLALSIANLERALARLGEALQEPDSNSLVVDGTIQRFEFAIELLWKTLRRALLAEGIETRTPREALVQAYQLQWIDHEDTWLAMLRDRNETSHIYDELKAREIYGRIPDYHREMQAALCRIRALQILHAQGELPAEKP
jgi:nucleotidyltransferase substrate binding protein (TIGR01987 family)